MSVCLSVAYIGPKLRTERPRKIKIGIEDSHVTRDPETIFKVKRSRSHGTGAYCGGLPHSLLKTVLLSLQIAIFVGIRGSVTHFSELGVTLYQFPE